MKRAHVFLSVSAGVGMALSAAADVITVGPENTVWTEAMQAEINASTGIVLSGSGRLYLNVSAGATLEIGVPISGTGWLVKEGAGDLVLRGDNTFTGECRLGGTGNVYVYSDKAFGSTQSGTEIYLYNRSIMNSTKDMSANGCGLYLCGVTCPEHLYVFDNNRAPCLNALANTTNTITGAVGLYDGICRVRSREGSRLVFAGGLSGGQKVRFGADANSEIVFVDSPNRAQMYDTIGSGQEGGCVVFNVEGNVGGWAYLPLRCGVDWAFDGANFDDWLFSGAHMKLDLGGHDQRVTSLGNGGSCNGYLTSSGGKALLHITAFDGKSSVVPITGQAGLAVEGNGTMTYNGTATSTGDLEVSLGTLVFGPNASWRSVGEVRVVGSGALKLDSAAQIGSSAHLALGGTGVLTLPANAQLLVESLEIDGVPMASGTYAASALNGHLAGNGATVKVEHLWRIDADRTLTEADQAEIDACVGLSIAADVTLTLKPSAGKVLTISQVIDGAGRIVKDGAGDLVLSGNNSFTGEFVIGGTGSVRALSNWALGTADGRTVVYQYLYTEGQEDTSKNGARLYLGGITTSEPISIKANGKSGGLFSETNTVNVVNGKVTESGFEGNVYALKGSTITLRGGYEGTQFQPSTEEGARIVVENKPISAQLWNSNCGDGQLVLKVMANSGGYTWQPIVCETDWAFSGAGLSWNTGAYHMKVDLNGHVQEVQSLARSSDSNWMEGYVTSTGSKAFLQVCGGSDETSVVPFRGLAGLYLYVAKTINLIKVSDSYGDIKVTKGTIAFGETATWVNANEVTVGGTGRLSFSVSGQIGTNAVVRLTGEDARIDLAEGTVQRIGELFLDGKQSNRSTYGGPESPAAFKDPRFTGKGVLRVTRGEPLGLLLLVR